MASKRKLLIVAGAGAAVEFGMPSVGGVHEFLLETADRFFPLVGDKGRNLYGFMFDTIANYWSRNVAASLNKTPNFEDVLYAIYALASTYPAGIFTGPLGAFVNLKEFPTVTHIGTDKPFDQDVLRHLGNQLVDDLIAEFRRRCAGNPPNLDGLRRFFAHLDTDFEIAVITTNYDDLIYRCMPGVETGFDPDNGRFNQGRIIDRSSWSCLLHLHGSVHFDMVHMDGKLHRIVWQDNLDELHHNSFGRSMERGAAEGYVFPTSAIIAGHGKTEQIQRAPFRTYFSELDRLVYRADAVLLLGFSFSDQHIRQAFEDFRDSRDRPVVCIDYADDNSTFVGNGFSAAEYGSGPRRAASVFRVPGGVMEWLGHTHSEKVAPIKAAHEFERCQKPGGRLSVWYNGMLDACRNADKIVEELSGAV